MTAFPPVPVVEGIAAPLIRDNVDTDAIIPSREIKGVGKTGLADGLFAGWRYTEGRTPDPAFVLNDPHYAHAPILLGGANFGCGSSREHAVWALHEYGVRAVIAPSFAPIFAGNCVRNGIIPVVLPADVIAVIAEASAAKVDLAAQTVSAQSVRPELVEACPERPAVPASRRGLPSSFATEQKSSASTGSARTGKFPFDIDPEAKAMLAEGLDAIDLTLKNAPAIAAFHARDRLARPWIYLQENA